MAEEDFVSIHARTRRATQMNYIAEIALKFQSTPARGGRQASASRKSSATKFQSTPARGGRRVQEFDGNASERCFNPRPHAAGDGSLGGESLFAADCFNPRPHAAGDAAANQGRRREVSFNPRPHAAGDLRPGATNLVLIVSIHARTRRATSFLVTRPAEK